MSLKTGRLLVALVSLLVAPAPGGAAGPVVEAAGPVTSTAWRSCGPGGTTCHMFGASNLAVDLSTGAAVLVTTDEYFCELGTRGNEVFAAGSCEGSESGEVTCRGSGSLAGEVWTSRLTLSPAGELTFTKEWGYDQFPWNLECRSTYVLKGLLLRF